MYIMCGESNSDVEYSVSEIYLYGKQLLKVEEIDGDMVVESLGEETTNVDGTKTANVFGNSEATIFQSTNTYGFSLEYPTPFTISYTYDKNYISGNGQESSRATMKINLAWYNDENNNEEDTKLGNLAYNYKLTNPDDPALKIVVKVSARRAGT